MDINKISKTDKERVFIKMSELLDLLTDIELKHNPNANISSMEVDMKGNIPNTNAVLNMHYSYEITLGE